MLRNCQGGCSSPEEHVLRASAQMTASAKGHSEPTAEDSSCGSLTAFVTLLPIRRVTGNLEWRFLKLLVASFMANWTVQYSA